MGCSAYTKILVDIRMGIEFAGRNLFFSAPKKRAIEKVHHCAYVSNMGRKKKPDDEKATKPGVSLDQECRIILSKILEWELAVHNNDLTASQAIRKCMRIAWQRHYAEIFAKYEAGLKIDDNDMALLNESEESAQKDSSKPSKVSPTVGVKTLKASENFVSTRSTATKKTSRPAG